MSSVVILMVSHLCLTSCREKDFVRKPIAVHCVARRIKAARWKANGPEPVELWLGNMLVLEPSLLRMLTSIVLQLHRERRSQSSTCTPSAHPGRQ